MLTETIIILYAIYYNTIYVLIIVYLNAILTETGDWKKHIKTHI